MAKIFKYPLEITDVQVIALPKGAVVLSVGLQFDRLCIWALVDDGVAKEDRIFYVVGTGHPMPVESMTFLGTVQMAGGMLIWHVFIQDQKND